MARLYADENVPLEVVERLRALGHDVLTAHEAGQANQRIEDDAVLRFAAGINRSVLTINRKDFKRLHRELPTHSGIVICTESRDYPAFAGRIDTAITEAGDFANRLLKIVRGNPA